MVKVGAIENVMIDDDSSERYNYTMGFSCVWCLLFWLLDFRHLTQQRVLVRTLEIDGL